jgi:hypothetical protein
MLIAALAITAVFASTAQATGIPAFAGTFRLTTPVTWGETVLQPGNYTITIAAMSAPTAAIIADGHGRPVARLAAGIDFP